MLRNRRSQKRISQVRPGPVESPVRDFLQRHTSADDTESPGGVLDRQRSQRGGGRDTKSRGAAGCVSAEALRWHAPLFCRSSEGGLAGAKCQVVSDCYI